MMFQSELWLILHEEEQKHIWEKFYYEFQFNPNIKNELPPFKFQIPVNVYDINDSRIYNDDETINNLIKSIFIECMNNDDFMYVLDWQHTCFRYNPRVNTVTKSPVFVEDGRYEYGGYNVYFPSFYPNGDYYFFIAKDFRWGYLTHPWLEKVWIFGDKLITLFKKSYRELDFIPCTL